MDIQSIKPEEFFRILSVAPRVCVDNIVFKISEKGPEVLLVMRKQEPAKGCLYPIGKSLVKNMFSEEWTLEALKKETGMAGKVIRLFGIYESIYSRAQNPSVKNGLHDISIAFLTLVEDEKIKLDDTSSGFKWISSIDELPLPPYTKKLIQDSGVFSIPVKELLKLNSDGKINYSKGDYRNIDFSEYIIK